MLAENLQHWAEKEREEGREEIRQEVLAVREETKLEMILGMIALGNVSDEQIATVSGFSLKEIATLRKNSAH